MIAFEWGPTGAQAVADGVGLAVVVDVLSFTTTLTVAVERGIEVLPFPWKDERAAAYATEHDAVLAVGRSEARAGGGVSLSPASLATVAGVERLVLPSPNGSTIASLLADSGATVVGACLRNAPAVARWLAPQVEAGATVCVIAAGERWPDGSLRPAVEDLWGAGAVLAGLPDGDLTPEAATAAAAYDAVRDDLAALLPACVSGRELVGGGFADDVAIAGEVGVSDVVPVLRDGVFLRAV